MRALAALLLLSSPALAAGLASHSYEESQSGSMEGLYAAAGGGGGLLITNDNGFGYDIEARLGYSFNPGLQIYLAGASDAATISGLSTRVNMVAAFLQYHLWVKGPVKVYGRAGVGVAFSSDVTGNVGTAVGLGGAGGLGLEIQVGANFFLAPELFYRNADLVYQGASQTAQVIGLQVSLIYY